MKQFPGGDKAQLIILTHLGINLSILLSELTLKIVNVFLPVLTADTKLFQIRKVEDISS